MSESKLLCRYINEFCGSAIKERIAFSKLIEYIRDLGWNLLDKQIFTRWVIENCPAASDRLNFGN